MDDFDTFRAIYTGIDKKRRTVWSMAQAKWSLITTCGMNAIMADSEGNRMAAYHHASAAVIIEGVKAYAQMLYDSKEDSPYEFVPSGQKYLNQGRWNDLGAEKRKELACQYDRRVSRIRVVK